MGQPRLTINFEWQIGFLFSYIKNIIIIIDIPFIEINIGIMKEDHGIWIFNKWISG